MSSLVESGQDERPERERVGEADERGEVDADLGVDEPRAALAEESRSGRYVVPC